MMRKVDWIQAIKDALDPESALAVYQQLLESDSFSEEDKKKIQDIINEIFKEAK